MGSIDTTAPHSSGDVSPAAAVDPALLAQLTAALYEDLRSVARRERFRGRAGSTLCTTALVSEAWLKLRNASGWQDEEHFMRTAALAMRQVLVNDAVARQAGKRNPGQPLESLDGCIETMGDDAFNGPDLVALDDALSRLDLLSPRQARVVECRYFAGYTEEETARALGLTDRTVRRDWVKARAWLYLQMQAS